MRGGFAEGKGMFCCFVFATAREGGHHFQGQRARGQTLEALFSLISFFSLLFEKVLFMMGGESAMHDDPDECFLLYRIRFLSPYMPLTD